MVLRILENDQLDQMKNSNDIRAQTKREALSLYEGKFQNIFTFFLLYIKNAWT